MRLLRLKVDSGSSGTAVAGKEMFGEGPKTRWAKTLVCRILALFGVCLTSVGRALLSASASLPGCVGFGVCKPSVCVHRPVLQHPAPGRWPLLCACRGSELRRGAAAPAAEPQLAPGFSPRLAETEAWHKGGHSSPCKEPCIVRSTVLPMSRPCFSSALCAVVVVPQPGTWAALGGGGR